MTVGRMTRGERNAVARFRCHLSQHPQILLPQGLMMSSDCAHSSCCYGSCQRCCCYGCDCDYCGCCDCGYHPLTSSEGGSQPLLSFSCSLHLKLRQMSYPLSLMPRLWRERGGGAEEGEGRPLAALKTLSGWKRGPECLENQSRPVGQVGGLGVEGGGGEYGCVDEIRHEGPAAAAAAEAVELCGCGCERSGGLGEGRAQSLNQWPLGPDPGPSGCESLAGLGTAPGCCW